MNFGIEFYDLMSSDATFLQVYVDSTFNDLYSSTKWKEWGTWGAAPTPIGSKNMFTKYELITSADVMADVTARFSETKQIPTDGLAWYSDKIPNLSKGFQQNVEDIIQAQDIAKTVGGNASIIEQFTNQLRRIIGGQHAALTNMSAQLLSTGTIDFDGGITYKMKETPVPTDNFRKAGATAWSDEDALIVTELLKAMLYADSIGMPANRVIEMTKADFANLAQNKEVKDTVGAIFTNLGQVIYPNLPITVEQFNTFVNNFGGRLAPISIVEEYQYKLVGTELVRTRGWKEGNIVIRPAGKALTIEYNDMPEFRVLGAEQGINVAYLESGRIVIKRKFLSASEAWTTDVYASGVPTFNNWKKHIIIDSLTTGTTT